MVHSRVSCFVKVSLSNVNVLFSRSHSLYLPPRTRTHTHAHTYTHTRPCHTRYTEFKDCKAKAVVQAIESVVEFKTRVKEKVLTAFKEAQAARGPPSEKALSGADSLPWIPSPDDQSYYEYVNRLFRHSRRSQPTGLSRERVYLSILESTLTLHERRACVREGVGGEMKTMKRKILLW